MALKAFILNANICEILKGTVSDLVLLKNFVIIITRFQESFILPLLSPNILPFKKKQTNVHNSYIPTSRKTEMKMVIL